MSQSPLPFERINALHQKVDILLKQKVDEAAIRETLIKEGIEPFYAQTIIDNVLNDRSDKKNFWKLIFGGLFFVVGGLLINYFSYRIADNSHSSFFYLFWGIIVIGVILIMRAFIIFRK